MKHSFYELPELVGRMIKKVPWIKCAHLRGIGGALDNPVNSLPNE